MLRPSNSANSLGSMDSKGDASTGSEGLYDWTAPRFGGLSVASEPKPELTLADGARFPEFRPDDGSLFAAASPDARRRRPAGAASSPGAQQRAIGRPDAAPATGLPRDDRQLGSLPCGFNAPFGIPLIPIWNKVLQDARAPGGRQALTSPPKCPNPG